MRTPFSHTLSNLVCTIALSSTMSATRAQFNYVTNDGTITITGYTGLGGDVVIPQMINGLQVVRIGTGSFQNNTNVTKLTIADGVTSVDSWAFYFCTNLTSISIPSSLTNIGYVAFCQTQLTNVTLYNGTIGPYAFTSCLSLDTVTLGKNVFIDVYAFYHSGVRHIQLPENMTAISEGVFDDCTNLTIVHIPETVTNCGAWAFASCRNLKSIAMPKNLITIGYSAFAGCTSLGNVTIPSNVTGIRSYAFGNCSSLTGVYFEGNAPHADSWTFLDSDSPIIYYVPWRTGWGSAFCGRPTAVWLPQIVTSDSGFGVWENQFGFNIKWATGATVVVYGCTDFSNPSWLPVSTNTLPDGGIYHFSDPLWTLHPARFYRVESQ